MWKDAYVWDDRQAAEAEIQKHFADLTEKYAADPQRVVLVGHSMGGEMAIWLAIRGSIPNRGFVAFGPTGPFMAEPESWEKLVLEQPGTGLRGYFIVGEEDTSVSLEAVQMLVDILNEAGILCELELVPHAGHEFAPEFESSLLRALEFILGE